MRILRDPSLLSYHKRVVRSLMIIFKSMGLGCVPYLPKVLPELFHTVRTSDENLKDFITWGLGTLVSIVRQHIRKYLPELLSLVSELWSSFTLPGPVRPSRGLPVLHLLEHLCLALNDEFRTYLPDFTIFIESIHKLLLKHRLRHKEFEEIYARSRRREPLIVATTATQQLSRRLPVEVIRDPVIENEIDPFEEGNDKNHQVNDGRLRTAGEASQRSTKEDWEEWMRHFSIELLKESPSPALRTCAKLAQLQPFVGRELFAAGFVSCWAQLNEASQTQLVRSLEMAFSSPNIPPEILATLLNLAEFMEHDEKPLPIDIPLHYKEMEFEGPRSRRMDANPVAIVEALIHINNQLHQHEAAVGILTYAQQHLDVQLKESWYEKLQRWDDALKAYTLKASQTSNPHLVLEATLGKMRCLAALARWEELNNLCKEYWSPAEPSARLEMAPMAANAAWNMGEWDQMAEYVSRLDDGDETKLRGLASPASSGDGSSNGTFFRAVLLVRRAKYDEAREYVERARKCLATELAALVLESYERAYSNMVRVQQLSELEEVIEYYTLPVGNNIAEERRALIRSMWTQRIQGSKRNVEVWQSLLAVRALVLPPTEDVETWLKFASLCRKSGRISQAKSTLLKLLPFDPEVSPEDMQYHGPPQVMLGYLKYQWSLGEERKRKEAFAKLQVCHIPLKRGFSHVSIDTWLVVLPQIIARIHSNNRAVRELIQSLLIRIGENHPQVCNAPVVTIASFSRQLLVITSKQRPRKLTIHGNDGEDYAFLLKGHEDLRQDERVMQIEVFEYALENTEGNDLSRVQKLIDQATSHENLCQNYVGWCPFW
ncbi:hypothetical protein BRARA_E01684 [Brassica rapa]|uniref:Serine/threonine-protein kinase TOR n=1 Tax=Brassica campestris TaxID=3711 RepID=A0A397ZJN9_BRACM|nr:hypothetical protein BRARA_E01684 [Brassica rapa]